MTANTAPYEECRITVNYAPIRPDHETMVLSGFDHFGTQGMIVESNFADGSFTVFLHLAQVPVEHLSALCNVQFHSRLRP